MTVCNYPPQSLVKLLKEGHGLPGDPLIHGDEVAHIRDAHAYGIVISVEGDAIKVLWSKKPSYLHYEFTNKPLRFFEPSFVTAPAQLTGKSIK